MKVIEFKLPTYVKFKSDEGRMDSCCMKLLSSGKSYWRHGGAWEAPVFTHRGRIFIMATYWQIDHLDGMELVECAEAEWRECNGQYADDEDEDYGNANCTNVII